MAYEQLLQQGRIKPYRARLEEIRRLLKIASRDLGTAERTLANDADWAFTIAYNAVLQALRAIMLAKGFRPRGAEQHGTVVQFASEALGKPFADQVSMFDRMRRKRHRVVYESAGLVSQQEAEQGLAFAKKFVEETRRLISKQTSFKL